VSNPRLRRTLEAEQDLLDIWNYIAPHSRTAADNLLRLLDAKSAILADNPFLAMARADIGEAIRHFPVGDYLILYRALDDGAEIVRYVHGRRRLRDLMK
jgi:toxin ParE1/3/4